MHGLFASLTIVLDDVNGESEFRAGKRKSEIEKTRRQRRTMIKTYNVERASL